MRDWDGRGSGKSDKPERREEKRREAQLSDGRSGSKIMVNNGGQEYSEYLLTYGPYLKEVL